MLVRAALTMKNEFVDDDRLGRGKLGFTRAQSQSFVLPQTE
jgi:hypothetical protein